MSDEWRVEVQLADERHGHTLGERLHSLDLDDEARKRLGRKVIVTRDGPRHFLYAGTEQQAREAERVARDLVAEEGLRAEISLTRWHPIEEEWKDAALPLPETDEQMQAEYERREAAELRKAESDGEYDWEVRVDLPGHAATVELARRLEDEGVEVRRRWTYLLVGAPTEERAAELGERIRAEAPEGTEVHLETTTGIPHPVFVFMGAHKPGIARDLGL